MVKKNNYMLIAGAVLLLVLGYELAFKKTLAAWQLHRQLVQQLARSADISTPVGYLSRKNANLDRILQNYRLDSALFRSNVITTVAALAEQQGVKLTALPPDDPFYHTPRFIIQKLDFTGDFFALLKLVRQLEQARGIGMLRSVAWKQEKIQPGDGKSAKVNLEIYLEIYR